MPLEHDSPISAGYDAFSEVPDVPVLALLNQLKRDQPRIWDEEPFDALPFYTALEYMKSRKPQVLQNSHEH
jgi:hypothetical protein